MKRDLLLHSMSCFAPITLPILEAINAKTITEIGAEHGGNSKLLYDWLKSREGQLLSIDCAPSKDFLDWLPEVKDVVKHIPDPSLECIKEMPATDAWFVDGDHNWYTVYNELQQINEQSKLQNKPLLIFFHDVAWPCARRDLYYAPERIPQEFTHEYTWDKGLTLDNPEVIQGGFRSNGAFALALKEGGEKNGVLTGIEDFLKEHPKQFCFAKIPAVFGLGVLFDATHPQAEQIAMIVAPFNNNPLLQLLETNRLDNYLKVIELQDQAKPEISTQAPQAVTPKQLKNSIEDNALAILNTLDQNHQDLDVWNDIENLMPDDPKQLDELISYLDQLMGLPQDQQTIKIVGLAQAVCQAKFGDLKSAHTILDKLNEIFPNCTMIFSAYKHTLGISNNEQIKGSMNGN